MLLTTLLFFLPSVLLGMVPPVAVKHALDDLGRAGKVVGRVYAASTVGSLVGTFLTGFVLIAHFGTRAIILSVGLTLVAFGALAGALARGQAETPGAGRLTRRPSMRDVLRTALCDLLGIEYPVIQSGMGSVAGPDLVAEVSRAGGLGILAGLNVPPDELRSRIRQVRELTDRPFGVNLWLHTELRPPADPATISDDRLAAVHAVLNGFRAELGLPARSARPGAVPDIIAAQVEVILEERPAVFSIGLGDPGPDLVGPLPGAGDQGGRHGGHGGGRAGGRRVGRRRGRRPGQRGRRPPLHVGEAALARRRQRRDDGARPADRRRG